MSRQVWENLEHMRALVRCDYADIDAYLSPLELAEQYREIEDAPGDDEYPYAMSVWDAHNGRWVDV